LSNGKGSRILHFCIVRLLEEGGEPFGKLSSSLVPLSHHEVSDFGVEDRTGLKPLFLDFDSLCSSYDPSGKNNCGWL